MAGANNDKPEEKNHTRHRFGWRLDALEKSFAVEKYPSVICRRTLSEKLGLSYGQISSWFCRKWAMDRVKLRKKEQRRQMVEKGAQMEPSNSDDRAISNQQHETEEQSSNSGELSNSADTSNAGQQALSGESLGSKQQRGETEKSTSAESSSSGQQQSNRQEMEKSSSGESSSSCQHQSNGQETQSSSSGESSSWDQQQSNRQEMEKSSSGVSSSSSQKQSNGQETKMSSSGESSSSNQQQAKRQKTEKCSSSGESLRSSQRQARRRAWFRKRLRGKMEKTTLSSGESSSSGQQQSNGREEEDSSSSESLNSGEKQLNLVQKEIEKCNRELSSKKQELVDCDNKLLFEKKKLCEVQKLLKECRAKFQMEEEKLQNVKSNLVECSKDLKTTNEKLESVRKGREKEIMKLNCLKEKIKHYEEINAMQKFIGDGRKELSIVCSDQLQSKQRNLESVRKSLAECGNVLSANEVQKSVIKVMCCEYLRELDEQKKHFDPLKRTTEERVEELEKKEKQLEQKVKSVESQNSEQCSSSLISLSPIVQCCIIGNGMKLQMLLSDQLRRNDLANLEIFKFIKMSPDPAKLVLDAVQGFYPTVLNNGQIGFDLSVIRRSCTTLLDQLIRISPQIKPHVREEALKLALEWKERLNLGHENSLESTTFLKLLAAYKLDSAFSIDELQNLLEVVESKQKLELYEALSKGSPCVDIEQSRCSDGDPVCSSSANSLSSVTDGERSPELFLDDLSVDHNLTDEEVSVALQLSPDPAKFVLDVMQGSYFKFWNDGSFDASLTRNIVLMLEELMKISPKASHEVKEVAFKQVLLWKEKISLEPQNSLEILAFLMFLAIYDLVSYFRRDEVLKLVETIVYYKQAPEIC